MSMTMNAYDDAGKLTKEAMDNTLRSFAAMTKGFQQISAETADFTKRSYDQQTAMMERLFQARTLDKTIEVQSDFAKTAYEAWVAQMTRMSDIYAGIAKETYKPFEQTAKSASAVATKAAIDTTSQVDRAAGEAADVAEHAVDAAEQQAHETAH
ncbi:phasin family protein [Jiella avicenniae]|uniref:Phasin family protein n=1 Tax=Jiella avicenniae TaxID=2907202 RepID=A0A9X1T3A9_9HYPH|nr:phasin family protein [Jiella avicenniae]MCE7027311.1 phasin family protein [Jiella avicenniae]